MKEIRKWIADDGAEFDDEFECLKYEERFLPRDAFIAADSGGVLDPGEVGWENVAEKVIFIWILDKKKSEKLFDYLYKMYGDVFPRVGSYNDGEILDYNERDGSWRNLSLEAELLNIRLRLVANKLKFVGIDKNEHEIS